MSKSQVVNQVVNHVFSFTIAHTDVSLTDYLAHRPTNMLITNSQSINLSI